MNYYYNPPRGSKLRKDLEGGFLLDALGKLYTGLVKKWGSNRITDLRSQREEIARLEDELKKKQRSQHRSGKAVGGCAACKRRFRKKIPVAISSPDSIYSGGKLEGRDIVDFLAGPIGWAFMGVRKSREKKIDKLKKQLNGGMIGHDGRINLPLESPARAPYKLPPKLSLAIDGYQPQQQVALLSLMDDFNHRVTNQ